MADLNLYIDTQNKRLVESFSSRNAFRLPKFFIGDSGIVIRLHLLEPTSQGAIDRPYQYIDPTGSTFSVGLGLIDQAPTSGTFTITDPDDSDITGSIAYNASSGTVQTAIRTLNNYPSATVTGDDGGPWTVDRVTVGAITALTGQGGNLSPESFVGIVTLREGDATFSQRVQIRLLQQPAAFSQPATAFPVAAVSVTVLQNGSATANEIQRVSINSDTYSGTFTITATTLGAAHGTTASSGPIPYNATAASAQSIINEAFGSGNEVTVVLSSPTSWDIEFTGANVLNFNHATMTGDASGLEVPVGVSGTLDLNTGQSIVILGNEPSLDVTFEIQQSTSGAISTLIQEGTTLYNDLIDPETTGATALPTYVQFSDLVLLHARTAATVSSSGDTEISITQYCKYHTVRVTASAGAGAYTRNIDLDSTNRASGDKAEVVILFAASVNPTIVVRDNGGPTTLYSETGSGVAYNRTLFFTWSGSAWESDQ
jgi:hypothetical protein